MKDEVDTTTRWVCPVCKEVVETDYGQLKVAILVHKLKCPVKNEYENNKERR